jgi:hypothetical protein
MREFFIEHIILGVSPQSGAGSSTGYPLVGLHRYSANAFSSSDCLPQLRFGRHLPSPLTLKKEIPCKHAFLFCVSSDGG